MRRLDPRPEFSVRADNGGVCCCHECRMSCGEGYEFLGGAHPRSLLQRWDNAITALLNTAALQHVDRRAEKGKFSEFQQAVQ